MDWHGHRPRIVSWKDQHVMTANDPLNDESRSPQRLDDLLAPSNR